jgi:hypothetical protein
MRLFVFLALAATCAAQDFRFAHPDAGLLLFVDWERVSASPAGVALRLGEALPMDAERLDFIRRLERIALSAASGPHSTSLLARLDGDFDLDKLSRGSLAEEGIAAAVAGPRTIVLGDPAALSAALDRLKNAQPAVASAAAGADAWLSVSSTGLFSDNPLAPLLREVSRLDVSLRGEDLEIAVAASDPASAERLHAVLAYMARSLGTGADLSMEGSRAVLRARAGVGSGNASFSALLTTLRDPALLTVEAPKKIRIYGLEDGVREILFED